MGSDLGAAVPFCGGQPTAAKLAWRRTLASLNKYLR
jgi:hypothetical protein